MPADEVEDQGQMKIIIIIQTFVRRTVSPLKAASEAPVEGREVTLNTAL